MLAGFLVASAAAAMVGVYFLMSDYMVYMNQTELLFREQYTSDYLVLDDQLSSAQLRESELISLEIANLTEDIAAPR
ncbi:MAG: hypothetical protein AAF572_03670 [Cyanobacteria bacterium P01_B01_bin.77]